MWLREMFCNCAKRAILSTRQPFVNTSTSVAVMPKVEILHTMVTEVLSCLSLFPLFYPQATKLLAVLVDMVVLLGLSFVMVLLATASVPFWTGRLPGVADNADNYGLVSVSCFCYLECSARNGEAGYASVEFRL
ncbi:hypothetical protein lerEdw1_015589 [Lerista edwardsae]|nr:hypothetical protein lerEdw1_015589 [Lerista edwardsae]